MSGEGKRVVVIQDASRDVSLSVFGCALGSFSLKPGDKLTLLAVLHQVNNPSTLSFKGAGKILGYKSRVNSNSMFGANNKLVEDEVAKKREEYHNNVELIKISELYAAKQVEFKIAVIAGSPPKMVAVQASRSINATWVILDRQMKKDKKYFMEKLSCGISRMKRDNSIEQLRGPKAIRSNTMPTEASRASNVTYDEMMPGSPDEDDLFSLDLSPIHSFHPSNTTLADEEMLAFEEKPRQTWKIISKSLSSEHLMSKTVSSSSLGNTDASSLSEGKCSPLQFQADENNMSTLMDIMDADFSASIQEMHKSEPSDNWAPDQECYFGGTHEYMPTPGHPGWQPGDAFESSVCSVCNNKRPRIGWQKDFTYTELQAATNGFSDDRYLSEGGFGSVYKGRLGNGLMIAVKQHKDASAQGEKEFKAEVHVLSKARHRNVVMLLGSCLEGNHRLLVYEYVCNGSLDQHISKKSGDHLSWADRVKIALGAARGLQYLHETNIIHRDMRPHNILVTHDHEALLGDFGLARTQFEETDHSLDNRVVGTFGYVAPEYAECGRVSTKTDVYSYGVVLLGLITGLRTTDKKLGEESLVEWARPLLQERKYPDLIDSRILDSHDFHQLFWIIQVAEKCLTKDPEKRISMEKVVDILTKITSVDTVCSILDFSPAHSDSVSSITESTGSQGDEGKERIFVDADSINSPSQRSGIFSSEYSSFTSKSSSTNSSRPFLSKKNRKEGVKPRKYNVSYGEMLL